MNIVTEQAGVGSAVLLRALEPLWSTELMAERRGQSDARKLTGGPGMMCQALDITLEHNHMDACQSDQLWLSALPDQHPFSIGTTPRIGISSAQSKLLRFIMLDNIYISGTRKQNQLAVLAQEQEQKQKQQQQQQ